MNVPYNLTFCNVDDDLIRVWGIVDRDRYEYVESVLAMNNERLTQGMHSPQTLEDLAAGSSVLVKHGEQFKRGIIIRCESAPAKTFKVRLIDVGNHIIVPVSDIRMAGAIPHLRPLGESPCAEEFVLGDALAKPSTWTIEEMQNANRLIRMHGEVKVIGTVANKTLIVCPIYDNQNLVTLAALLVRRGVALFADVEIVKVAVLRKHAHPSQFASIPPPRIPPQAFLRYQYPSPEIMPPLHSSSARVPPGLGLYPRMPMPAPKPKPEIRPQHYRVDTLPVGSHHEVFVSHVIEGAQSFMIQLKKNMDEKLSKLMALINDVEPEPVDQLLIGTMCLGRFSEDGTLCRAVVSMVQAEGAHLLFVDFGNSETVPFDEIYKIPPQFIEEPIIALSFTLAKLSNYPALNTQEARKIFEDLVINAENLIMVVAKPEIQLKQYCELYFVERGTRVNVKQKVLDKVKLMKPANYQKLSFKANSSNDVIVSYVESASKFFVQLEVNQPLLDTLMSSVEEYCLTSEMKDFLFVEDVNENMAVCSQYVDNKWYRGLIAEEPSEDGKVAVFYVDYGNQDTVHFSKLRIMNNEMISKLPTQAVECRLDIDADFALREDVIQAFVDLVDTNAYKMKVINVLPSNVLLVDLFDENDQNVKDVLFQMFREEVVSPTNDKSPVSPSSGNWRERKGSSNEGDFSSFRREENQQRSRGSDDRGQRNFDFKRQESRGVDETDDAPRTDDSGRRQDGGSSYDRAAKRPPRDDWSGRSNGRDEDNKFGGRPRDDDNKFGGRPRDDGGGGRRFERDGGDRKPFRRHDDGDSQDGGDRKPFGRRDDSAGGGSRDGDFKKPFNRDDRRGGGYRRNDDDWNRGGGGGKSEYSGGGGKSEYNGGEKSGDDWGAGKSDSGFGGKRSDSDWSGRNRNDSERNAQRSDDWGGKKNDDWNAKKSDDQWSNKKGKNESDDWKGKKNDSEWGGKPKYDRDERRPRRDGDFRPRDGDFKPRDGGFNSRDGPRTRGGGFGSQNDSFQSAAPTLSDGYPAGSQIAELDLQVGQQMDVAISWFINPVQFYLIPADNADFRQLMETVQPDYPQRKNAELNSLSSGDFVVARDKDQVIYRAKVIRTRPGGATVSFVDYGNNESVGRHQIWTISSDHCAQPAQAVCCGLYNISSTGEGGQWSLPADVDKYFGKEKYSVTFVECREERSSRTWFVNLVDESNADVADLLVADGFAVKNIVLQSEELYDIELLRDQIITTFPGHIESSKKFFVHLDSARTELIQESIVKLAETPGLLIPLPTEKICEGEFCLAMAGDNVFYRAHILSVNEAEKSAHIVFIDYGDEQDAAFDTIKTLPEHLMIYNPQIVECCLHDAESFTDEDAFHEALNETDFIMKVMDIIDNKLSVFLYDINGARLPYPVKVEESVDVLCSFPVLRAREKVFITHITPDQVYLSRTSDAVYLSTMCDQLKKKYDEEELSKLILEPGVFYAAKSKIFETWYRCILPSADAQEVFYIDYGNTEPVADLLAVKPLDKSFFASPAYCIGVSTSIRFTCPDLAPLVDLLAPVVFNATLERRADTWFAVLKCEKTDKSLGEFATEHEFTFEPIETDVEQPYVAFGDWQLNDEKRVTVAHVDSPNKFYLQLTKDAEKIAAMQQRLQLAVRGLLPVVGPVDELCAARKFDGQWCRAKACDNTAFAVDFGETMTSTVMKKLPLSFAEDQSDYIVECSLNVKPVEGSWTDAVVERFTSLVASGQDISAKLEFAKSPKVVDLVVDGVSVGATLVEEGLAQWQCHEVIVSHANSLSDFYIQEPERENDLFELAEQLKEAGSWESVEPAVDDLVVAQFDEDELWYRAVIVKIEDDARHVRFVDYGNESVCAQFRALPESLTSTPYFASKCTLHNLPENADELSEKFVNLVTAAEGSFTAYYLSREEPMMVLLYYNDADLELALQGTPEAPEAPAVTEEVTFKNVAVCLINSPSSFYVQAETAPLDSVATALVDVASGAAVAPSIGDVVAALFPDDGMWYRARIADVVDGSVNVLFIDYGNWCDVTELRQLPESVRGIPALAKHCAFTLPAGLDQWPDIAKQRFSELICEGNTIFKLNLLEEGDPAYVDLQDEGVNVADELATLCKADLTTTRRPSEALVLLSHVESVTEIWIQFQTPQLDEMADEMANADTFEAIDTVEEGSLVAALFEEDGNWYRAKVTKVEDATYDVLFIDYGNRSTTSNIKSLPADLVNLPALAKCCQLKDFVEVAESHVGAVVARLKESVDAAQTFTLHELVDGDVNFVSLGCDDDEDLTSVMIAFYNKLVHSTVPASAQFADAAETPDNVVEDAVESAQFGDVGSEGVTESEKIVSSASEEIAQSIQQEDAAVVDNRSGVAEEKTDIVQVAEQVLNAAVDSISSNSTVKEPVEELDPNAAVDDISEEKESVPCQNGERGAAPVVEKETPTSQNTEEAHPCQNSEDSVPSLKVKKASEEIHEIANSVSPTGNLPKQSEILDEIAVADDLPSSDADSRTPEKSAHDSSETAKVADGSVAGSHSLGMGDENLSPETTARTPEPRLEDKYDSDSELTPEFKTPLSKRFFDADDSSSRTATPTIDASTPTMEVRTASDDESGTDYFESAVGPVATDSPSSMPGGQNKELELMDLSMESGDDGLPPSCSTEAESVDQLLAKGAPPLAQAEEFDDSETWDSAPVARPSPVLQLPKSTSASVITSYASSLAQFADADESTISSRRRKHVPDVPKSAQLSTSCLVGTAQPALEANADELADLFSGMAITDKPQELMEPKAKLRRLEESPGVSESRDRIDPDAEALCKVGSVCEDKIREPVDKIDAGSKSTSAEISDMMKIESEVLSTESIDSAKPFEQAEPISDVAQLDDQSKAVDTLEVDEQSDGVQSIAAQSDGDQSKAVEIVEVDVAQLDDQSKAVDTLEVDEQSDGVQSIAAQSDGDQSNAVEIVEVDVAQLDGDSGNAIVSEVPVDPLMSDVAQSDPVKIVEVLTIDDALNEKTDNAEMAPPDDVAQSCVVTSEAVETPNDRVEADDSNCVGSVSAPVDDSNLIEAQLSEKRVSEDSVSPSKTVAEISESAIATEVAGQFFEQIVASANHEFDSTSNPFLNSSNPFLDSADLMSFSTSTSDFDDSFTRSTSLLSGSAVPDSFCEDTAKPVTDVEASEDVAQFSVPVESTASRVPLPNTIEDECLPPKDERPPAAEIAQPAPSDADSAIAPSSVAVDSTASRDLAQSPITMDEFDPEGATSSPLAVKDDSSSLGSVAQSSVSGKGDSSELEASKASPISGQGDSPVRTRSIVVKCRPPLHEPTAPGASFGVAPSAADLTQDVTGERYFGKVSPVDLLTSMDESGGPTCADSRAPEVVAQLPAPDSRAPDAQSLAPSSVGADATQDLPWIIDDKAETAPRASDKFVPPADDDSESLSSGDAEVARTMGYARHDNSYEGALVSPNNWLRPPRIVINGAPRSEEALDATDRAAAQTPDRDDASSVYFDSCAEPRLAHFSDDDQQPKSLESLASDEAPSGGDEADEGAELYVVSYVNTPGNFYVQRVADADALRGTEERLREFADAEVAPEEVRPEAGRIYGAEIDGRLYRVRVLETSSADAGFAVCCVDYGRVGKVRRLFGLPASVQSAAALATACAIPLPCYLRAWPVNVCHEFERMVTEKQRRFQLRRRWVEADAVVVDLVRGSVSVAQRMKTLCEDFNPGETPEDAPGKLSVTDE